MLFMLFQISLNQFCVDKMPLSSDILSMWALLVSLAGSTLKADKDRERDAGQGGFNALSDG